MLRGLLSLLLVVLVPVGVLAALAWPTDDEPQDPDAVVVLGGANPERTDLGVEIAEEHDAVLVLSSNSRYHAGKLGYGCDDERVRCFEPDPVNTIGEARNVAVFAAAHGWTHVTVATSTWHTSRARVAFRQCLGDGVSVVGVRREDQPAFDLDRDLREALGTVAAHTFRRAC
jgi:uncharacterized SAM-binding protein YcdF (DUF218 family)